MRPPRLMIAVLALLPASLVGGAGSPAVAVAPPGMTWDSIKPLPDFSGWWGVMVTPGSPGKPPAKRPSPPLKPEILARRQQIAAKLRAGVDPTEIFGKRPIVFCGPHAFTGSNGSIDGDFEFLFTPGRVTITSELGLIRRIPLDGRPLPARAPETNSGTSTGHWEGRTLVIETIGIRHDYPYPEQSLGRNARIVERISLNAPDVLQIITRTTAPDVYTSPFESTTLYRRDRTHVRQSVKICSEHDRSVDEATGHERFDMTPPPDLPPPPE
jgi:hypothetical protein